MTLVQFRESEPLVAWLRELLDSPEMKMLMEAMAEAGPDDAIVFSSVSPHYANIIHGKHIGFANYAKKMKSLLTPLVASTDDLESGYEGEQ